MRFRSLHSRAFWFGVPGLVFLLWGWWVSTGHYSGVWFRGKPSVILCQLDGKILVVTSTGSPSRMRAEAFHFTLGRIQLREVKAGIGMHNPPGLRKTWIPHLWIILAYVAIWAGLLLWRKCKYEALPERPGEE